MAESFRQKLRRRWWPFTLTFLLMMVTWCVLSGFFDSFHLTLGVISSLLVSWTSSDLLFPRTSSATVDATWWRFPGYAVYLIKEIVKANVYVFKMCFAKDVERVIDPCMVSFKTTLKSRIAQLTLANSITLTPGTITIDVTEDGVFTIHSIDYPIAEGLLSPETNEMERRIARLFGEE